MATWAVSKYTTSWVSDGTIPSPRGQTFSEPISSTMEEMQLADGGKALIIPETKYLPETIKLYWHKANSVLKTKLETYLKDGRGLRLTTHVSGKVFEGYITKIDSEWMPGTLMEYYHISIDFMIRTVA